ncbi:MAG: MFS transporter [Spirochaetales bacterium]|jgi:predicted MFS family arabinose efflux permease|nr:MFS transporter [Spirochaetales bacterium]
MKLPNKSVVFAGSAVAFSLFGDMAMYTILPTHFEALGLLPIQVGLLLSVNRWIRLVTNRAAERLLSRYNRSILFGAALGTGALLAAIYAAAPPFMLLLLARLLWGFCWSILRLSGTMIAVESSTKETIGKILGFYHAFVRFGFLTGTLLGGLFFDLAGYRGAFLMMAACTAAGIPFALSAHTRGRVSAGGAPREKGHITFDMRFQGFILGAVGSGIIMSTLGNVLSTAVDGGGVRIGGILIGIATINGIMLASRHLIGIAGSPFLGSIVDRIGIRKSLPAFFAVAGTALGISILKLPPLLLVIPVIVFFLCETALQITLSAEAGRGGPVKYSRFASAQDLGSACGPLIGWGILQFTSISRTVFAAGALLYLIAAVVMTKKRREPLDRSAP